MKAKASPEFFIQGEQSLNDQVYDLDGSTNFDEHFRFIRGGLGAQVKLSDQATVYVEYMGGKGFDTDSDPSELNIIAHNVGFGLLINLTKKAHEKIDQSIIQLLIEEDLLETIVEIGMQFQVGTKGDRLSGGQRQKVAIARAFLKTPNIIIMDEATSGLDNKSQARIQNQLDTRWKGKSTVIAIVHRLDITKNYDKIAVLKAGKIIEMGTYDELIDKKGVLHDLVVGKK